MATYKGVVCEKHSKSAKEGIEAVVLADIPRKETLAGHEVRIEVHSASINFPELLMMQNKYQFKPKLPFVLCTEGSGVVREVGPQVTKWKLGDRVFFASMEGCAAEEKVLHEATLLPLPETLSFSQGAGFPMGYTTGYHALVHRGKLQPGEWLLVTGAGGGMGLMAVELGKALGARVIAAASSDDKLEICKKVGADYVVNYSKQKLKDAVDEITKGEFCDVIYDPVGGDIFDQCVRCVSLKGYARLLVIGFASGTIPKFPVNMALIKGFSVVGVRMGAQMALQPELQTEMMTELVKMAAAGKLKPYICAEYPMEKYKAAFTLMEEKKVVGKCIITFNAPAKL
jgi:NADPH2:quinone reductase